MLTSLLEAFQAAGVSSHDALCEFERGYSDHRLHAGDDFIDVRFDYWVYRYDTARPGGAHAGDRYAAQKPV